MDGVFRLTVWSFDVEACIYAGMSLPGWRSSQGNLRVGTAAPHRIPAPARSSPPRCSRALAALHGRGATRPEQLGHFCYFTDPVCFSHAADTVPKGSKNKTLVRDFPMQYMPELLYSTRTFDKVRKGSLLVLCWSLQHVMLYVLTAQGL